MSIPHNVFNSPSLAPEGSSFGFLRNNSRAIIMALVVALFVLLITCYYFYHKTVTQQKVINMMNDTNDRMAQEVFQHAGPSFVDHSRMPHAKGNMLNPWARRKESPSDHLTVETSIHPKPRAPKAAKAPKAPKAAKAAKAVIISSAPSIEPDDDDDEQEEDDDDDDEERMEVLQAARPPRKTVVIGF